MSHARPFGQGAKPPAKPKPKAGTKQKPKATVKQPSSNRAIEPPDWEAIEREYRAGQLSIRQIARQQGVAEATMRKRAKTHGWTRDLADAVREEVQAALVRTAPEIITYAVERGVEVVRQHREHLGRLQRISTKLAERLERFLAAGGKTGLFDKELAAADVLVKIANATARWMPLERQAFGLDRGRNDDTDTPKPVTAYVVKWRTLFEQAGIAKPADGGTGCPTARCDLPTSATAIPSS